MNKVIESKRPPTTKDKDYKLYSTWVNTENGDMFILSRFENGLPSWRLINGAKESKSDDVKMLFVNNKPISSIKLDSCFKVVDSGGDQVTISLDSSQFSIEINGFQYRFKKGLKIKVARPLYPSVNELGELTLGCDDVCHGCFDKFEALQSKSEPIKVKTFQEFQPNTTYLEGEAILYTKRLLAAKRAFVSGETIDLGDWEALYKINKEISLDGGGNIVKVNDDSRYRFRSGSKISVGKSAENEISWAITNDLIEGYDIADAKGRIAEPQENPSTKRDYVQLFGGNNIRTSSVVGGIIISSLSSSVSGKIRDSNNEITTPNIQGDYQFVANTTNDLLPINQSPLGISIEWGSGRGAFRIFTSNHSYLSGQVILQDEKLYSSLIDFTSGSIFDELNWNQIT